MAPLWGPSDYPVIGHTLLVKSPAGWNRRVEMNGLSSGVVDWKMIGKIYYIITSKTEMKLNDGTQPWLPGNTYENRFISSGSNVGIKIITVLKKIENCYPLKIFLPDNLETCRVGRKKEEWKTIRDLSARLMLHRVMWRRQSMSLLV